MALPETLPASTLERIFAAAGVAGMLAATAAVWHFDPKTQGYFPVCPLFAMTGLACPGCGMTRGFHSLLHGDVLTALDYNAILPLFGALIAFFGLSLVLVVFRGRGLPLNLLKPQFLWSFFVILIVFGVVRNLPVYPFSVLFP